MRKWIAITASMYLSGYASQKPVTDKAHQPDHHTELANLPIEAGLYWGLRD